MIRSKGALGRGTRIASLIMVLLCGACGEKDVSLNQLMADAAQARAQSNHAAAIIHLKNAVQNFPENPQARYLLGVTYLDHGDPQSAEEQLRRALNLGADPVQVALPLGRSLLRQGKFKEALEETIPKQWSSAQEGAEILNLRALAQLSLGLFAEARKSLDEALVLRPDFVDAMLTQARLAFAQRDWKATDALIDKVLAISPSSLEGWRMKGDLQRVLGKQGAAIAAYAKALEMNPDATAVRLELAAVLIAGGRYEEAASQLATARAATPADAMANYLQALLEFRRANYDAALASAQQALKSEPRHLPSMLLAGEVEYRLGRLDLAEQHLTVVRQQAPGNLYARKLMAAIQLKKGQYLQAIQTLEPVLDSGIPDAALYVLAAEAYLQNNQYTHATHAFERAAELDRKTPSLQTDRGLSLMAAGETERAIAQLEVAAARDGQGDRSQTLLAMAYIKRGEFDRAFKAIAKLDQSKQSPLIENLKAAAYLGKRDTAQARNHFERALKLGPTYYPAAANLAQLDLLDGDVKAARQRFESVLAQDKANVQAMLALANLTSRLGGTEQEILDWIARAKSANRSAPAPFATEAEYYLRTGQTEKALAAARGLQKLRPNNPETLEVLGQALLASGQSAEAVNAYAALVALQPDSPFAQVRLATAQMATQKYAAASVNLRKALQLRPGYREAQVALAALELEQGHYQAARRAAKQVQKDAPRDPAGYMLEGDVLLNEKNAAQAAALYEKAYGLGKSALLARKIHLAWALAGKPEQGDTRIAQWLKENPGDSATQLYLADDEMRRGKYAAAISRYRAVLAQQPDNALVLNNLAWTLHLAKDPQALNYAQQAFQLKPNDALIIDTLGWIVVEKGDLRLGVELLEKAARLSPDNPEIRYHLAQALARSGEDDQAIKHLELVVTPGSGFPRVAEATALLKRLRGR